MKVAGFSKVHWVGLDGKDDDASSVTLFFDEPPCLVPNAVTAVVIGSTRHKVSKVRTVGGDEGRAWYAVTVDWTAAGVSVGDEVIIETAL